MDDEDVSERQAAASFGFHLLDETDDDGNDEDCSSSDVSGGDTDVAAEETQDASSGECPTTASVPAEVCHPHNHRSQHSIGSHGIPHVIHAFA